MQRNSFPLVSQISLALTLFFSVGPHIVSAEKPNGVIADREQVSQWITQLGDQSYSVRRKAMRALIASETEAMDLIVQATSSKDHEVSRRSLSVLSKLIARSAHSCDAFITLVESDTTISKSAIDCTQCALVWSAIQYQMNLRFEALAESGESQRIDEIIGRVKRLAATCEQTFDRSHIGVVIEFQALKKRLRLDEDICLSRFSSNSFSHSNSKELALCLLKAGRIDLESGKLKSAREKALAAQSIAVTYGLFEDRPEVLLADIQRLASRR